MTEKKTRGSNEGVTFTPLYDPVLFDTKLTPTEKLVYCLLARLSDDQKSVTPNFKSLSASTSLSERSLRRSIGKLEEYGYITRKKHSSNVTTVLFKSFEEVYGSSVFDRLHVDTKGQVFRVEGQQPGQPHAGVGTKKGADCVPKCHPVSGNVRVPNWPRAKLAAGPNTTHKSPAMPGSKPITEFGEVGHEPCSFSTIDVQEEKEKQLPSEVARSARFSKHEQRNFFEARGHVVASKSKSKQKKPSSNNATQPFRVWEIFRDVVKAANPKAVLPERPSPKDLKQVKDQVSIYKEEHVVRMVQLLVDDWSSFRNQVWPRKMGEHPVFEHLWRHVSDLTNKLSTGFVDGSSRVSKFVEKNSGSEVSDAAISTKDEMKKAYKKAQGA